MLSKKDGETEKKKNKQTMALSKSMLAQLNVPAWLIVDDSFLKQGRTTRQNKKGKNSVDISHSS